MDHATRCFAAGGYHPTSVAEICDGLGVGKGVFYWYFASKEELFLAILREGQRGLRRHQLAAVEGEDDPVDRLACAIRAGVRWSAEHQDLLRLLRFAMTEQQFAPALKAGRAVAVADAASMVKDAMTEGRIPESDPDMLANAVVGVTYQLAGVYLLDSDTDPEHVADIAATFCLRGLNPKP